MDQSKPNQETAQEIVASWKWRIPKAGHTVRSFCEGEQFHESKLSLYISGKTIPRIDTFDMIEGKLRRLGV